MKKWVRVAGDVNPSIIGKLVVGMGRRVRSSRRNPWGRRPARGPKTRHSRFRGWRLGNARVRAGWGGGFIACCRRT